MQAVAAQLEYHVLVRSFPVQKLPRPPFLPKANPIFYPGPSPYPYPKLLPQPKILNMKLSNIYIGSALFSVVTPEHLRLD